MTARRVLLDPDADRRLARDGFVVVPLVSPAVADSLREDFLRRRGREGSGFQSDLVLDEPAYRRDVATVVGDTIGSEAAALFDSFEPFLHNYLCKWPGEDSGLYLHRDWMYVDERAGESTFVVWTALQDITGPNGQLRVLRGSHLLDDSLRGTGLEAPWLEHTTTIERRLLTVPVPAGHAVVFDNRLVHCSLPNLTDEPRLAVAVGLKRVGVPLTYFRRDGDMVERFDVDDEFFCDETPQGLAVRAPERPVVEVVPYSPTTLTAAELAHAVDSTLLGRLDQLDRVVATVGGAPGAVAEVGRRRVVAVRDAATERATAVRGVVDTRVSAVRTARRRVTDRVTAATARVRSAKERVAAVVAEAPSKLAMVVLGANEFVVSRFGPKTPAVWDPAEFEWSARVEAGWPAVRAEVEALLAGPREIPHIEDVTGGIPQGNVGPWRSFVMMHQGRWIDWNCDRCPETTALVRTIPGLMMAGFSVLEPGTHITEHRGPNKGALRYQLGVIVPGRDGDCRIRVGTEMIHWRDGEGVVFDFTVPHEAWNDTDEIRVLLMLEVLTPLPWYLRTTNRWAQRAMGWFPTTRDMKRRLATLEPTLLRSA